MDPFGKVTLSAPKVLALRTDHECMTSQTGCRANGCPPLYAV